MHELVCPRISTYAGGSRTPRPADASTRTYAISNSGKTAVRSWGRSPTRYARHIKFLRHGNGGLRVIYFESSGYTKRRAANPYREGVPNPLRPETHDTLTSGSSTFFTFMRKSKTSAGPTYVTCELTGAGRTGPGATAQRLPGDDCDRLLQADRVAQAGHGWPQRETRLRLHHRINYVPTKPTTNTCRMLHRGRSAGRTMPPQTRWAKLPEMVRHGDNLLTLYQLAYALVLSRTARGQCRANRCAAA
jgi:hypothetical protein